MTLSDKEDLGPDLPLATQLVDKGAIAEEFVSNSADISTSDTETSESTSEGKTS